MTERGPLLGSVSSKAARAGIASGRPGPSLALARAGNIALCERRLWTLGDLWKPALQARAVQSRHVRLTREMSHDARVIPLDRWLPLVWSPATSATALGQPGQPETCQNDR